MMTVEEKRADAEALFEKISTSLKKTSFYEEKDLDTLFSYAFDQQQSVWEWCFYYFYLADKIPVVREKLLEIMCSGKARDRWIAAISVSPDKCGAEFCKEIIRLALTDKSEKVRRYGVMRAVSFCYKEFAELVKQVIDSEKNIERQESLEEYHRYLKEDFFLEKINEGKYRLNYSHGFMTFETDIEGEEELRKYVLEHFSDKIYLGYWKQAKSQ